MTLFHYKAINSDGRHLEGTMDAGDKFEVSHTLKKDGNTVVSVEEKNKHNLSFSIPFIGKVSAHDKIIFARNLAQMIEAGLPLTRGLSIMERQAKPGQLLDVLRSLNDSISKGETLSDAMKKFPDVFSDLFVSMVHAGEESGNIVVALKNVSMQMEKSYLLAKKIKGALMYPLVILCLMIVIGVLMMVYMVPTLTSTFVGLGVQLPLSTRIIIMISDFLKSYFLVVVFGVLGLIILVTVSLRSAKVQRMLDFLVLHMPIMGEIAMQINSARTTRTLSSLVTSGVDIVVAVEVTKEVLQNSYYKEVLDEVKKAIEKGEQISTVFSAHPTLYPLFVGEMVAVGEETGKIGDMLLGVATFYEEEVDQKTKDMSSVIEPVLMIFIGLAVGMFAISMISPMYSLANTL